MSTVEQASPLPNPERGFLLNFAPKRSEALHDFCGNHVIAGAICPNCVKPLLRILSLSTTDSRLNVDLTKTRAIHLLYCWACSIPYGTFSYLIRPDGGIEFLEVQTNYKYAFGPEGPYEDYTGVFPPKKVGLAPLTGEQHRQQLSAQSDTEEELELYPSQAHQIGGFPIILNPQAMICPTCLKPSPFLALICDDASGNQPGEVEAAQSFTNNPGTQMVFHFCRDCSVVSAYHSND